MGPSSRYRVFSYLPYYKAAGIEYRVSPLFGDWYLKAIWNHKSKLLVLHKIIWAYIRRIKDALMVDSNSIVYIGAELLPFFPPVMEFLLYKRGVKYIIEFDDAVFCTYDYANSMLIRKILSGKFPYAIRKASVVICGCQYLADYASQWNRNVVIIPTSIDANKYFVKREEGAVPVVGWIGSSSTSPNIRIVAEAIRHVQKKCKFEFVLVGYDRKYEYLLNGCLYKILDWKSDEEVRMLNSFTIGIMPLADTPFSRGKCAFKLVQYMSVGIPTISTPLQSNVDIDKGCGNLFAKSTDEWEKALLTLLLDQNLCREIGERNKAISNKYYTFQVNALKYINIINNLKSGNG